MTTLVISNRLFFGPHPDGQTEARTSFASLETPEESQGIGGMYGARLYPPLAPEDDHFARPEPGHHHRPHARVTDHHHRPHAHETAPLPRPRPTGERPDAFVRPMTPEEMKGAPDRHHHRPHEREPQLTPSEPSRHLPTTRNFTKENADAVRATAKGLGISPRDLSTIIGYETIGSYSPSKQGPGGHVGLIQFGRNEQRKYGVHPGQTRSKCRRSSNT
jgi:hypothetical protein